MAVSEGRVPLVLCGGNIIQRNCIFPSPWLLVLTPVAEIGRPASLCQEDLISAETTGGLDCCREAVPELDTASA